jgi:hypothetical protein
VTRDNRGRHKGARSPQTLDWDRLSEEAPEWLRALDAAANRKPKRKRSKRAARTVRPEPDPAQPGWLTTDEYEALLALRGRLGGGA